MNKRLYIIRTCDDASKIGNMLIYADITNPIQVEVKPYKPTRSIDQNSKMWPMLGDISKQVKMPVTYPNGETKKERMTTDEWKNYFSGHLKGFKQVPGIEGGMVMIGRDTSGLNKQDFSDLIELMYMFGANHKVEWSEESHKQDAGSIS